MYSEIECYKQFICSVCNALELSNNQEKEILMSKLISIQLMEKVVSECFEIFGAYDSLQDHPLEKVYQKSKMIKISNNKTDLHEKIAKFISEKLISKSCVYISGDVGSGKTVVSALAALQAIEAGYQVALMVPTEILSEQHFKKIEGWLTVLGIKVERLTGSMGKKDRVLIRDNIKSGIAQIVVGTHALFQSEVVFKNLVKH